MFHYSWARPMSHRSSIPNGRKSLRHWLVLGFLLVAVGCATSQTRFSKSVSPEPSPVATEPEAPTHTDDQQPQVVPPPRLLPAVVQPVAFQEGVGEEMPAPAAAKTEYPLDMSTALALVAGQNPQVAFSQRAFARVTPTCRRLMCCGCPRFRRV